jgi:hypothetical protein
MSKTQANRNITNKKGGTSKEIKAAFSIHDILLKVSHYKINSEDAITKRAPILHQILQ